MSSAFFPPQLKIKKKKKNPKILSKYKSNKIETLIVSKKKLLWGCYECAK